VNGKAEPGSIPLEPQLRLSFELDETERFFVLAVEKLVGKDF